MIQTCARFREAHDEHGNCPGVPEPGMMVTDEQMLGRLRAMDDDEATALVSLLLRNGDVAHRCFIENHVRLIPDIQTIASGIVVLSEWIDKSYPDDLSEELRLRRRTDKMAEEVGEVVRAINGVFGENPRKGVTHAMSDVEAEIEDVAVSALGALFHVTGHNVVRRLAARIETVLHRAGLAGEEAPDGAAE